MRSWLHAATAFASIGRSSSSVHSSVLDPKHPLTEKEVHKAFERFRAYHDRNYANDDEETTRLEHFRSNLDLVRAHNARPERSWDMGLNQFSDLSDGEFEALVLMKPQDCTLPGRAGSKKGDFEAPDMVLPEGMDWRERGVVSEVKSQGDCASSWAFASTGCLEAHLSMTHLLSEQQLVDCAEAFGNHGCQGGLASQAFEYIKASDGLTTEAHYPYAGKEQPCSFHGTKFGEERDQSAEAPKAPFGVKVHGGSVNLTAGDEARLKRVLASKGPVSLVFPVASDFRHYSSGIYTAEECRSDPTGVTHAALALGYGAEPTTGMPYWIVKNSWGYSWGEEGFFKIEAFKNMCGIADCMAYPDLYSEDQEPAVLI